MSVDTWSELFRKVISDEERFKALREKDFAQNPGQLLEIFVQVGYRYLLEQGTYPTFRQVGQLVEDYLRAEVYIELGGSLVGFLDELDAATESLQEYIELRMRADQASAGTGGTAPDRPQPSWNDLASYLEANGPRWDGREDSWSNFTAQHSAAHGEFAALLQQLIAATLDYRVGLFGRYRLLKQEPPKSARERPRNPQKPIARPAGVDESRDTALAVYAACAENNLEKHLELKDIGSGEKFLEKILGVDYAEFQAELDRIQELLVELTSGTEANS
ncbi:hypothetical protein [Amycolatopsis sp. cmx-4-61]|uniref:hypothetical protein n=1 Tax=Amycolatopsis sp. cmx-4-61 TaxID=2790937 RepID=UPI00397AD620